MKVLVVGDLILDIYHHGRPLQDSVEAVTTIREHHTQISYGGAGLLVRNLLQLGGEVNFVAALGSDEFANFARNFFAPHLKQFFVTELGRQTTVKERFVADGKKVLKWNHLDDRRLAKSSERKILNYLTKNLPAGDKLAISDYRHGLISRPLAASLVKLGKKFRKPVYVDSQIAQRSGNHRWYQGADLICLNKLEAQSLDKGLDLEQISRKLKVPNVVVKLGSKGSTALVRGKLIRTPARKVKAIDSTGAGDAFFASLSLGNFPPSPHDLRAANQWAALTTTKIGTELP